MPGKLGRTVGRINNISLTQQWKLAGCFILTRGKKSDRCMQQAAAAEKQGGRKGLESDIPPHAVAAECIFALAADTVWT